MKRTIFHLGLVCLAVISPFSLVFGEAALSAGDSVVYDLAAIFRMADEESRQIRVSEAALRAANEGVRQAKNALTPRVNISLSGSYIGDATLMSRGFSTSGTTDVIYVGLGPQSVQNGRQPTPHWGNIFSVEASQVIYAGGAIMAGIEMAKIGERIAELDVAKSRQEVRLMLAGYYLDLVRLQNQRQVIDRHIEQTNKVLEQMRARESAGVVLRNDITRYELQLKQLELTRIRLIDAQSIIHHQLATSLHRPAGQTIVPDTVAVEAALAQLEQSASEQIWQSRALSSHLGIRQAEAAQEMSEQQVKMARSGSMPTIALIAKDELSGPYTSDLIPVDANVNVWFVGVGLQYDLGSLWHNYRAICKAKTEREAAQQRVELAREGVNNGVHAAYVNFLTAFTEVETQQKQVQLADENYALVEKRYNNELALLTDLLDASSMKLQADMALVNARVALLYNYYQLKYTTHTL